jgi:hypothetical protein
MDIQGEKVFKNNRLLSGRQPLGKVNAGGVLYHLTLRAPLLCGQILK